MPKRKWVVTVTTAPRKIPTVSECVESLLNAGWNPTVFAEPGSAVNTLSVPIVQNDTVLGVWDNWLLSARWSVAEAERIGAEVVMTVQDDVTFHPQSQDFINNLLWPHPRTGYVSLYTPKHYQFAPKNRCMPKPIGVYHVNTRSMWGATALAFPTQVLKLLCYHRDCDTWIGCPIKRKKKESKADFDKRWLKKKQERINNRRMIQNSDTVIGRIIRNRLKRKMYYTTPSLTDHFATTSACGHGGNGGRRNAYFIADHSLPLNYQFRFAKLPSPVELEL